MNCYKFTNKNNILAKGAFMYKRVFSTAIIMAMAIVLLCTGCSSNKENKVIFGSDLVKYDLQGVNDFGFNVNLIVTDKNTDVEFVSFTGENTQGLAVQLMDDTYESIENIQRNGYYIRLLGFKCYTADPYVEITGVNLKIDGEEKYYQIKTPIKHTIRNDDIEHDVHFNSCPMFISTNVFCEDEFHFSYTADKDIKLLDFYFNDFIDVENSVVKIDGVEKGSLKTALPLNVKKDSSIVIKCTLNFKNPAEATKYDSIYCDSILLYESGGVKKEYRNNLVSQSVSNEEDAEMAIDLLSEEN